MHEHVPAVLLVLFSGVIGYLAYPVPQFDGLKGAMLGAQIKKSIWTWTLALTLMPLSACSRSEERAIQLYGEMNSETGPTTMWEVTADRLYAQKSWLPSDGPPPLSIAKASEFGTMWLKKRHPEIKEFKLRSIELRSQSTRQEARWYYLISCNPVIDGQVLYGGRFVAVVLFDGSVVEPNVSK